MPCLASLRGQHPRGPSTLMSPLQSCPGRGVSCISTDLLPLNTVRQANPPQTGGTPRAGRGCSMHAHHHFNTKRPQPCPGPGRAQNLGSEPGEGQRGRPGGAEHSCGAQASPLPSRLHVGTEVERGTLTGHQGRRLYSTWLPAGTSARGSAESAESTGTPRLQGPGLATREGPTRAGDVPACRGGPWGPQAGPGGCLRGPLEQGVKQPAWRLGTRR